MGCCESSGMQKLPETHRENSKGGAKVSKRAVTKGMLVTHSHRSIRDTYAVEKTLGSGGIGVVYLVRDKHTGTLFAMKELLKTKLNSEESQSLLKEVALLKELVTH